MRQLSKNEQTLNFLLMTQKALCETTGSQGSCYEHQFSLNSNCGKGPLNGELLAIGGQVNRLLLIQ